MSNKRNKEIWRLCPDHLLSSHFFKGSSERPSVYEFDLISGEAFRKEYLCKPFQISLSLTTSTPADHEVSFLPIVEPDDDSFYFPVESKEGGGDDVPREYMKERKSEWSKLSRQNMHKAFHTGLHCSKCGGTRVQRLLSYKINSVINVGLYRAINSKYADIDKMIFHMGANLSDFPLEHGFTFTPVIQLKLREEMEVDRKFFMELGFYFENDGSKDPYLQYLFPCPPHGNCEDD